ncbi:MAG: HEAT repeat domain-containing protein [Desulfobacterales bacterium]|nr:HEAT repeat domain-containing protein [Desulfobacterales bacterium]
MEAAKGRAFKRQVLVLLQTDPFDPVLKTLVGFTPRRVVNPLISFFLNPDPLVRWRAITAMGVVVAALAEKDMESARVVMRRLTWSLNDESGGIGWGAPEAMGEIMAQSEPIADEYARILISYIDPRGNYLEHEGLQRGVLWGIGRLARNQPCHAKPSAPFLAPYLASSDPHLRGLAAWVAVAPGMDRSPVLWARLAQDRNVVEIFIDGRIRSIEICELVSGSDSGCDR